MYLEIEGAERYRAALYIRLSREDETDGALRERQQPAGHAGGLCPPAGVPVAGLYVDDTAILGLKSELQ